MVSSWSYAMTRNFSANQFAAYRGQIGFPIQRGDLQAINLGTTNVPEWFCAEHLQIMPYQPWKGLVPSTYSANIIDAACLLLPKVKLAIMDRGRGALGTVPPAGNPTLVSSPCLLMIKTNKSCRLDLVLRLVIR